MKIDNSVQETNSIKTNPAVVLATPLADTKAFADCCEHPPMAFHLHIRLELLILDGIDHSLDLKADKI